MSARRAVAAIALLTVFASAAPASAEVRPIDRAQCAALSQELGTLVRRGSLAVSPELRASIRRFLGPDHGCSGPRELVVLSGADYVALTARLQRVSSTFGTESELRTVGRDGSRIERVEQTEAYRFPLTRESEIVRN